MKGLRIVLSVLAVFGATSAVFALQSRSQGAAQAGVRVPSNPGSQRNSAGIGANSAHANTPTTGGKPESAGPKDPMGFRNYGQYVAATHVAENLHIDFEL